MQVWAMCPKSVQVTAAKNEHLWAPRAPREEAGAARYLMSKDRAEQLTSEQTANETHSSILT